MMFLYWITVLIYTIVLITLVQCRPESNTKLVAIEPLKTLSAIHSQKLNLHRCEFSLQRIPGYSPFIKTDQNGKSCRGNILLPFCFGMCKTRETGTHTFPYREQEGYVCGIIGNNYTNVTLIDCDEGVDPSIRYVLINKSTTCGCIPLN